MKNKVIGIALNTATVGQKVKVQLTFMDEYSRRPIALALQTMTDYFLPYWKVKRLKKDKKCVGMILGCKVMLS